MERYWLPVCFLLMQGAWTSAVAEVASARFGSHGVLLTLPAALATLIASHLVGRRLLQREVAPEAPASDTGARAVPFASLLLGFLWSFGAVWLSRHVGKDLAWLEALPGALSGVWSAPLADALALAAVFLLWWHGQRTGQSPPEHDSTVRAFGIGALAFGAALLWAAGLPRAPVALTPAILLYLAAGLPALSLARLQDVRRDLQANLVRGEPSRLDATWWRTLAPPVGAVLMLALLAALLLSDTTWRGAIVAALGALGDVLLAVLYFPVLVVGLAAEWLVYLLRRLRRPPGEQEAPPAAPGGPAELLSQLQRSYDPPAYLDGLRWVALAAAGIAVLAAFLLSSRAVRRERETASGAAIDRESLSTGQLFLADLRALWRAFLSRLLTRGSALAAALPFGGAPGQVGETAARDAREAYRRLMRLGREHALARRGSETPDEYLASWSAALPAVDEAAELTATYKEARYGPPPAAPKSISQLRTLLAQIQAALESRRTRA